MENKYKEYTDQQLKKLVLEACDEFYMNKNHGLNLTDLEYDEALDELKSRIPGFDIFEHIKGLNGKEVNHALWFPDSCKTKVNDISWLIPETSLRQYFDNHQYDYLQQVIFVAHYQNGNLKYVTFHDDNGNRYAIKDLPNAFPRKLVGKGNVNLGDFRILGWMDINKWFFENTIDVTYLTMIKDWNNKCSWEDVRKAIISTDYFQVINLLDIGYVPDDREQKVIDTIQDYEWYWHVVVPADAKFSPKMDGCSVVVYYKNDKLDYIASRSNDVTGKNKTDYLQYFFPDVIPGAGDMALTLEEVIDLKYGFDWNSRQKANGLINSKYKLAEVSKFSTFVIYDALKLDKTTSRCDLSAVRNAIFHTSNCNKLLVKLLEVIKNGSDISLKDILYRDSIRTHVNAVHALGDMGFIESTKLLIGCFRSEVESIIDSKKSMVFGTLNPKQMSEINSDTSYTPLHKFEHGIMNGYRYCSVQFEGSDEEFLIFDLRDMKPKVTTVKEFTLSDYSKYVSDKCQAHFIHPDGGTYLMDGLVIHDFRPNRKRAEKNTLPIETLFPFHTVYKWTYNEVKDSVVEEIIWQESEFGTLIPVVRFKTVLVEGSWLSRASAGGYAMLMRRKMGVGAKVKIVRVNSTIPMILHVDEKAEVKLPVCPYCRRQLTEHDDVYETLGGAAVVKCSNIDCPGKLKRLEWFTSEERTFDIDSELPRYLPALIKIEGYSPDRWITEEKCKEVKRILFERTYDNFYSYLKLNVFLNMNRDKQNSFENMVKAAYLALRIKLKLE